MLGVQQTINPDRNKKAQEVTFSRRKRKILHPFLYFSNSTVKLTYTDKYFGLQLDSKLSFNENISNKIKIFRTSS